MDLCTYFTIDFVLLSWNSGNGSVLRKWVCLQMGLTCLHRFDCIFDLKSFKIQVNNSDLFISRMVSMSGQLQ